MVAGHTDCARHIGRSTRKECQEAAVRDLAVEDRGQAIKTPLVDAVKIFEACALVQSVTIAETKKEKESGVERRSTGQ